jgi:chromosome segregation ATPase
MARPPLTISRLLAFGLAVLGGACASGRGKVAVDLRPAQDALAAAREADAPKNAAASFTAAEAQLKKAEELAPKKRREAREAALTAEWMARLAAAEARCATSTATARGELQTMQTRSDGEQQRLQARLHKSEEEQRRLEERLAAEQRDLEVTEMELIRTKARLKGLETKAEASSAIAEANILLRRAENRSGTLLTLGQQSLAKAEQQLAVENYGAANFFALRAQDLAMRAQDDTRRNDTVLPLSVRVRVNRANLRQGPGLDQKVLTLVPRGTTLAVRRAQGDWYEITHGDLTAWVSRTVVE